MKWRLEPDLIQGKPPKIMIGCPIFFHFGFCIKSPPSNCTLISSHNSQSPAVVSCTIMAIPAPLQSGMNWIISVSILHCIEGIVCCRWLLAPASNAIAWYGCACRSRRSNHNLSQPLLMAWCSQLVAEVDDLRNQNISRFSELCFLDFSK